MSTTSTDLFSQICSKVANKLYFEQLMIKQHQFFDIQPYKIDKLYSESAKKLYRQICFKYQTTKELAPDPNLWHENQRKIFIWFVVCYFHQIGIQDPTDIEINWEQFSEIFFNKSSSFLKFQFLNIIKLKKRIIWTNEEDSLLMRATNQEGIGKWNQISKALFFNSNGLIFKTPKHCRQRWLNHLDGNKNKGKWTDEEDYKIFVYVKQSGKKWSKIVQALSNTRTEHMVKNRFNSLLTKNRKNKKQKQAQTISKIIKNLQRTLKLCRKTQYDVEQSAMSNRDQLQNEEQSGNNISQQKKTQLPLNSRNYSSIFTKSSFEISSFETMPTMGNFCFTNFYSTFLSINEKINTINEPDQDLQYQCHLQETKQSQKTFFKKYCQFQEKNLLVNSNKNHNSVCYKTKPIYIIQKSF